MRLVVPASGVGMLLAALASLPACHGDASGPPAPPTLHLAIAAGDSQTATVTYPLARPIDVVVSSVPAGPNGAAHATPLAGMTIDYQVLGTACGYPDLTHATTDSAGHATMPWTLGVAAGTCRMVISARDYSSGLGPVYDTAVANALPDTGYYFVVYVADTIRDSLTMHAGQSVPVYATYRDIYGNLGARCYDVMTTATGPVTYDASFDYQVSLTGVDSSVAVLEHPSGSGLLLAERAAPAGGVAGSVTGSSNCQGVLPRTGHPGGVTSTVAVRFLP